MLINETELNRTEIMNVLEVISTEPLSLGCVISEEVWESPSFEVSAISEDADGAASELEAAITSMPERLTIKVGRNANGDYIGDEAFARLMVSDRDIKPEMRTPDSGTCSIGFCETDGKWYGWSHRARYGFGIGSTCKRGDCAYNAPNATSFGQQVQDFYCDDKWYADAKNQPSVDADGRRGVLVTATYTDDVPNEELRGTEYRHFSEYPEAFGRGEWVAETLDDAKQMAADFAEGVS
jgi:hypothetical protein